MAAEYNIFTYKSSHTQENISLLVFAGINLIWDPEKRLSAVEK